MKFIKLILIFTSFFNNFFAIQDGSSSAGSSASGAISSQQAQDALVSSVLQKLPLQYREKFSVEDLSALLKAQGLTIAIEKAAQCPVMKDVSIQTDPVLEEAYASVFTRSFPSAEHRTEEKLLGLIRQETKGISASLYELNSYAVAYELCKKKQEGISVRLVFEDGCHVNSAMLLLKRCNIPMEFCVVSNGIMHKKVFGFDANKGKRILFDTKHVKDRSILDAISRLNPNEVYDKNLLDAYNAALDREITFYWDGSFNITGVADQKNQESTTVVSDKDAYPERKKEFENDRMLCSQRKTQEKLISLEGVAFKDTEVDLNSVPSQNALYLLKSKLDLNGEGSLSSEAILKYKDFVPKNSAGRIPMQELIPQHITLPFPCYLRTRYHEAQTLLVEVQDKNDNWLLINNALEAAQQVRIVRHKLKLHGIGKNKPVYADLEQWYFKCENEYHRLSDLQALNDNEQREFTGPYYRATDGNFKEVKLEHASRSQKYDKTYLVKKLKVSTVFEAGSLADLLKEYKS